MKNYKKILSAVMAMAIMLSFSGCNQNSNNSDEENADNSSVSTEESVDGSENAEADETKSDDSSSVDANADNNADAETEGEKLLASEYFDDTPLEDMDAVVMTVNGREITLEEYRYYFLNVKSTTDYGDETVWDGTESTSEDGTVISAEEDIENKLKMLKSQVDTYIKNNYTVEVMAENNNVSLDDNDKKNAMETYDEEMQKCKEMYQLDDEGWKQYLADMYCTEELYKMALERKNLEYKLIRSLYEDDFKENVLPDYVMAKHILLGVTDVDYEAVEVPEGATEEEIEKINAENEKLREEATAKLKEEKLALAEEILEKAKGGEDFDKLIAEYNEDPGEVAKEDGTFDGYLFTKGEMVEEFETAAYALEIDGISDIVETDYGYHIIKRVEISDEYLDENIVDTMMVNDTYYSQYAATAQEVTSNLEIEYTDIYEKINIMSLK